MHGTNTCVYMGRQTCKHSHTCRQSLCLHRTPHLGYSSLVSESSCFISWAASIPSVWSQRGVRERKGVLGQSGAQGCRPCQDWQWGWEVSQRCQKGSAGAAGRALRRVCCLQKGTPKLDLKIFLPPLPLRTPPPRPRGGSLPGSPRVGCSLLPSSSENGDGGLNLLDTALKKS